jgi:hypothetical protein
MTANGTLPLCIVMVPCALALGCESSPADSDTSTSASLASAGGGGDGRGAPDVPVVFPLIVVVGFDDSGTAMIRDAALNLALLIRPCELPALGSFVATWRPFAIAMPSFVVDFDRDGFTKIARDSGAALLDIPEECIQYDLLTEYLREKLREIRQTRATIPVAR